LAFVGVSLKNNKEQQELVRLMNENNRPIIICTGNAGTGKTFAALIAALQMKQEKKYSTIVYGRNPMPIGEDMGFLPGGLDEKYGPYMGPLYDNLEAIASLSPDNLNPKELAQRIEMVPIAFLRGRSFRDTILIIDEAQNLDLTALKAILTRVGDYSKVVLLGSMNQIDDPKQRKQAKCDFEKVIDAIQDLPYVGYVNLTKSMRSDWCVELDGILGEIDRPIKK
jgi:PhoH-like ATPase